MGKLKVDGNYLVHESGRRNKFYLTHKARNSCQIRDLTAVAKSIICKGHALNKNNLHELLTEPNIYIYIKCQIASQHRPEAKGIWKNIFKTIYNEISSQQQEDAQSNQPPKAIHEASAFLSCESSLVIYDISEKEMMD